MLIREPLDSMFEFFLPSGAQVTNQKNLISVTLFEAVDISLPRLSNQGTDMKES